MSNDNADHVLEKLYYHKGENLCKAFESKVKAEIELGRDDIDAFIEILVAGSLTAKCKISRSLNEAIRQTLIELRGHDRNEIKD